MGRRRGGAAVGPDAGPRCGAVLPVVRHRSTYCPAPAGVPVRSGVRAAGGVPVFAHPRASVRGRIVPDSLIVELAGAGLAGLEADHEDHTPEQRAEVRAMAAELGLFVTGSSDFHGANKTVKLGAQTTAPEADHRI